MPHLIIISQNGTGLIDLGTNTVKLKGKDIQLDPNLVPSPGDRLRIKGEEFTVVEPEPQFFPEFSRRTAQIIQPWDAAVILHYCSIGPGRKVLESGIGSGALSFSLLKAIGDAGKLTTVEINSTYIEKARSNVSLSMEPKNWEIVEGSIESYRSEERFDAAILDVPEPWEAVKNVSTLLRNGGKLCAYSPTYNQLEKNAQSMKRNGFYVYNNMDILKREILVRENATRPDNNIIGHTAFMTFGVKLSGSFIKA